MRILMISDVYFPRINGVSTSIQTFRREFQKNNHEVTLIAPDYGEQEESNDILRIPSRYLFLDPEDRAMKMGNIFQHFDALASQRFDLLHIQTPFVAHYAGTKLAKQLGIPKIETYHTFFEEYLYNYIPFLPAGMLRFTARRFSCRQCNSVDAVVVPSQAMLEVLRDYGVNVPAAVIPTGIELSKFQQGDGNSFRQKHHIAPGRPTLVHVGRIAHEKNIDFLIHALVLIKKTLPNILLIIAGEGPALAHLRNLTSKLDLEANVLFVGYLSRDSELLDCYRAGDGFAFSSRTETQGLVLLEAMAVGTPVISTAVMGTRDILSAGKGAMVAREDINDFADKSLLLLQNAVLRNRLSHEAAAYAQQWSASAMAVAMLAFYGSVTTNNRPVDSRPARNY